MYSEEAKKNILNMILLEVFTVSDRGYQARVWIRGEGPECDSYDDTVCNFFQSIDSVLKDYRNFYISDSQYKILSDFKNVFEEFCDGPGVDYYLPENFINSSEWLHVVNLAKVVLKEFNYPTKK
ncbi:MAG: hypothetical protein ACOYL1_06295 [Chlamydiia bacterium]